MLEDAGDDPKIDSLKSKADALSDGWDKPEKLQIIEHIEEDMWAHGTIAKAPSIPGSPEGYSLDLRTRSEKCSYIKHQSSSHRHDRDDQVDSYRSISGPP